MKRFFAKILICMLIISLLLMTGCDLTDKNTKLSVKESLNTNYDTLLSQLGDATEFAQLSNYLVSWAKKNKIDVKKSNDHYVVLSKPASPNYHDAETMTLHNSVSFDISNQLSKDLQCTAISLATLYSAEYHGPIKVIITEEKAGEAVGAKAVENSYINKKNFISMNYAENPYLYNKVAASSSVVTSHKINLATPKYTKAFKLHFHGSAYKSPYSDDGYPNPIKIMGDLLASCKSSGVLFELSEFNSGESGDLLPENAVVVVVLQENDVESFTARFEKSFEKVEKRYDNLEDSFHYTMTPVKTPKKVVSTKDTNSIVSLLYTLINTGNGAYFQSEEGEVFAKSSIGKMTLTNHKFEMHVDAKSLDNEHMHEMQNIFETTCGLCEVKYEEVDSTPLWQASYENKLVDVLSENLKVTPQGTLEDIHASTFLEKKKDLNLLVYGSNKEDGVKFIESLLNYMGALNRTAS